MEFRHQIPGVSSPSPTTNPNSITTNHDPLPSWWESISKARSRIHLLSTLLPDSAYPNPITALADSDRPARSFLSSSTAYTTLSSSLTTSPLSGAADNPICHWLYDTFLSSDSDLQLLVLSFVPLLAAIYLSRIHSLSSSPPSVAGFEAVLLAIYSSETKSRAGKPILISVPDLSQPSLYHSPRVSNNNQNPIIEVVSPPLEPQTVIKSTKRPMVVGVALHCYYKQISQMPDWSKLDFCKFSADWAGQDCPCKSEFDLKPEITQVSDGINTDEIEIDGIVLEHMKSFEINDGTSNDVVARGTRIPLPWELSQPVLRILGHCLLSPLNPNGVKDAASNAVRCLYARFSHDLVPQAILATRSLIKLDKGAREAAAMRAASTTSVPKTVDSGANTPSKAKRPEIHLVS